MNQQMKARWIAALRSGEYRQARRYLKKGGGFCCLGVLCDLVDPGGWSQALLCEGEVVAWGHRDGDTGCPSSDLLAEVGLHTDSACHLANINDAGVSFDVIANYIEENL